MGEWARVGEGRTEVSAAEGRSGGRRRRQAALGLARSGTAGARHRCSKDVGDHAHDRLARQSKGTGLRVNP
jgi:hypothetical protein